MSIKSHAPATMTKAQDRVFNFLSTGDSFESFEAGHHFDVFNTRTGDKIRVTMAHLNFGLFWAKPQITFIQVA